MSDYMSNYLERINASGSNIGESQFNTTANFINAHFTESPMYRVVKCNGQDLEIQLQDISVVTRSASVSLVEDLLKFILFRPNQFSNIGDLIEFDNTSWLVTDSISNNPLFPKCKIEKCNYTLQIKTGETKTLVGHDALNRPVYNVQPITADIECILKTTVSNVQLNQAINLPQGQVMMSVAYNDVTKNIKENDDFDLYNQKYKVIGFDYTNIVKGVGCLGIIAERVVNA